MRDVGIPLGTVRLLAVPANDHAEADLLARLHVDEQQHARGLSERRRREWIAGRVAVRTLARDAFAIDVPAMMPLPRGAPSMPQGLIATISHKAALAAALVAPHAGFTVGIDLETDAPTRSDLSQRVLTADELRDLTSLSSTAHAHEVRRRFAIKEAIYKAIDPWLGRYVGFREVELMGRHDADHGYQVRGLTADVAALELVASCRIVDGNILAWARARPR